MLSRHRLTQSLVDACDKAITIKFNVARVQADGIYRCTYISCYEENGKLSLADHRHLNGYIFAKIVNEPMKCLR